MAHVVKRSVTALTVHIVEGKPTLIVVAGADTYHFTLKPINVAGLLDGCARIVGIMSWPRNPER